MGPEQRLLSDPQRERDACGIGLVADVRGRASRELLLRVPGFGKKTVDRILGARRHRTLRYEDLLRLGAVMSKAQPFVTLPGWSPGAMLDAEGLRARFSPAPEQLSLF